MTDCEDGPGAIGNVATMIPAIPFGAWPTPITPTAAAAAVPRIEGARWVHGQPWWGESVPSEDGRTSVRRFRPDGAVEDVLPAPWSARSRVHEYGGGAWTTAPGPVLVFVDQHDQRVRRVAAGSVAALTPADPVSRYGGLSYQRGLLLAVRERMPDDGGPGIREIVRIPLDGSGAASPAAITVLARSGDFVAQPALSPDGSMLAWLSWRHPSMPWDDARVHLARMGPGGSTGARTIGGTGAALQPTWLRDGRLAFCDDSRGRWNIWVSEHGGASRELARYDADTGGPLWSLGSRWFAELAGGEVIAVRTQGRDELAVISPGGAVRVLESPILGEALIEDVSGREALVSGAGLEGPGLWRVDVASGAVRPVRGGRSPWGAAWMPVAVPMTIRGPDGPVHAVRFPPTNPHAQGPAATRPPYVVSVHGGPTGHASPAPSVKTAALTSRGIGVLEVNYAGSSGYGRAYRERLRGRWGVADVADVLAAGRELIGQGLTDPDALAIAGGSAGGWTVLCALVADDLFAAGIARYAVADLRSLARSGPEFESHYTEALVGAAPERADVYRERSPLSRLDRIRAPLLIEQGLADRIVPPAQSEAIRDELERRGIPHLYLVFDGEGHGFRRADTLVRQMETELGFLGSTLGFRPEGVPPVTLRRG